MSTVLRYSAWVPSILASLALFILMVMTFADVILRSVFDAPIEFAADLTRLLMAIMVFSAIPLVTARGQHISVDLLDGPFERAGLSRWRDAFGNLFCGAILIWPASRIYDLAERSRSYGDLMEYLRLPLHYIGWFVAAMTAITSLVFLVRGVCLVFMPGLIRDAHG